jgi:hypothetical protein
MHDANAFLDLAERQIAAPRKARMRAAEKRAANKDKAEIEREDLRRAYVQWRRERREALFAGPYGAAAQELDAFLKSMTLADAAKLIELVRRGPWRSTEAETRLEVVALVNAAITRLRERNGLEPFDDGLPGEPPTAFQIVRELLA